MRKTDRVLLLALILVSLTACSSAPKKLYYLDSRLAAPLSIPAGLDAPQIQPAYQLPDDAPIDASGQISGAGSDNGKDIERPPHILPDES